MTAALADAFRSRPEFQETERGDFIIDGTDFEARVTVESDTVTLTQELPTLDSTVQGETVAEVVADGWEETFRRRVADVGKVIASPGGEPAVERDGESLRVTIELPADPTEAPAAALGAANYVEGTWVEGIVPGYDYDERVQAIRNRARETGGEGA
ncbi:hypothetical protein HTSR_1977 [Halodesulfurarchaeum formicicum]|uniref:Uncharacterized protein n=1 Tax=Halodesulfurarchaeum formicicum TaxID=1873524 RepID=A0A1D8S720_9EURY|nr:DUF5813 family protein [Halodesulfurarchaeum formicicum]AOW81139.1 hypothetical protein HTSR_1977 [Halodesulfurarchaeum formicicum]APE96481.1 hypothetical protein HSR6_2052 [Halodesulfurarchaeum formicicum]